MGDFSAEWLALREAADHAARSASLTCDLIDALPTGRLRILDLGCGTGSNMRYLSHHLAKKRPHAVSSERDQIRGTAPFSWLLVDRDAALLAQVPAAPNVRVLHQDLATLDEGLFAGRSLVTAAALLDLVSMPWVRTLARRCRDSDAAVLFALTYDGRLVCDPEDPDDALVRELVNRHQKTDKGFGPALGPDAVAATEEAFSELGYTVRREPTDWVLPPAARELQRQLIGGWAAAAASIAPERAARVDRWRTKRLACLDVRQSSVRVGHADLAAHLASS